MTPPDERVKPAGRAPEKRAHESGDVPPCAVNAARYGVPNAALGRVFVATVRGATLTVMERVAFAVRATGVVLSVTKTVKVDCPGELGMPEMVPRDVRLNPGGRFPAMLVHE